MWRTSILAAISAAFIFSLLLAPGTAAAQTPGGQCNGPGSEPGTFAISPASGPAGSQALVSGSFQTFPAVDAARGGEANTSVMTLPDPGTVGAFWVETGSGDPVELGLFNLTIDAQLVAHFSGNVTIPANAAGGPHDVMLWVGGTTDPNCVTFTVVESVRQTAYPQTASTLPSTGDSAFVTVIGFFMAGAGWLALMRRRHSAGRT